MIVQDNKYVCTAKELAWFIAKSIRQDKPGATEFNPVNFSVLSGGYDGKKEPVVLASETGGWYGIRRVDAGFDDEELTLCCNYYGGGCPHFGYLYQGCSFEEIESTLYLLIANVLKDGEDVKAGEYYLIAETCYEASPTIAIVMENGAVGSVYCTSRVEKFAVMIVDDNCDDECEEKCYETRKRHLDEMISEGQIFRIRGIKL